MRRLQVSWCPYLGGEECVCSDEGEWVSAFLSKWYGLMALSAFLRRWCGLVPSCAVPCVSGVWVSTFLRRWCVG